MHFVFAIVMLIASYAITALTAKKPANTDAKPSHLQDFSFPQHDEGTPQPVVFGEVWTSDWMVLYYGNLKSEAIRTSSKSGKK